MRHNWIRLSVAVVLVLLLVAGGVVYYLRRPVPIRDILSHPDRYSGRIVSVRGVVTDSYGLMGVAGYRLRDETGELWVVSDKGAPPEGTRKTVRGEVVQMFKGLGWNLVVLYEGAPHASGKA
ncbi:MAG: hypothetical protein NZ741_04320, partial [Armatimonadetes bacterium]|nr:hypothetical protein [Armatimonadota bacterium]